MNTTWNTNKLNRFTESHIYLENRTKSCLDFEDWWQFVLPSHYAPLMFLSESILQTWCIDFLNDFGGLHTELHRDGDRWEERERGRATDMILELGTKLPIIWGRGGRNYCATWNRGAHTCPKWRGGRHIVFCGRILYFFYRFSLHIGGPSESVITFDSLISTWYLLVYFWGVLAAMLTKFETKSARVKGKGKEPWSFLIRSMHAFTVELHSK